MAKTKTSAMTYFRKRYVGDDPERLVELQQARESAAVARRIYELRQRAGLTQRQLAELVGTQHSVISRLEDDDYDGHSLSMLRRIAAALGQRIEVRFVPMERMGRARPAARGETQARHRRPDSSRVHAPAAAWR